MTVNAPIQTQGEAEQILAHLGTTLEKLLAVIAKETELVREGKLKDAATLTDDKSDLARRYVTDGARVKISQEFLLRALPAAMAGLREQHQKLSSELRVNQIVLATAHAVSEGIVRGVSGELTRKTSPSTYGAAGRANAPSSRATQPLAVSRQI